MTTRRTPHGERRATEDRPVSSAWNDAQQAGANDVFYDAETGNYIVRGRRQRIHVFIIIENDTLRLHTSFANPARNTQLRLRSGRWQVLSQEEYEQWQERLMRTLQGE